MGQVVRMDGGAWSGSDAGWRASRREVERRVRRWRLLRRLSESWVWALPAAAFAVSALLFATVVVLLARGAR